jgi:hypothetical protein
VRRQLDQSDQKGLRAGALVGLCIGCTGLAGAEIANDQGPYSVSVGREMNVHFVGAELGPALTYASKVERCRMTGT